jgi:hypothetical protein
MNTLLFAAGHTKSSVFFFQVLKTKLLLAAAAAAAKIIIIIYAATATVILIIYNRCGARQGKRKSSAAQRGWVLHTSTTKYALSLFFLVFFSFFLKL